MVDGSAGTTNQVLTSAGSGAPPTWSDVSGANIPAFDDDAAAGTGGLTSGDLWKTSATNTIGLPTGVVLVKA